jgi:N-acetylmuramoyl-L-alanine amidase
MGKWTFSALLLIIFWGLLLSLSSQASAAASCTSKAAKDIQIVLDVGHTPTEPDIAAGPPGVHAMATGARGMTEYFFNLRLAERIKEELLRAGFHSTFLMLTTIGYPLGLRPRVDRANNMNADIFLSIHHDSVSKNYLEKWIFEGKEHFFFDRARGFSLHVSPGNIEYR